ncbi:MAG: hypothetical protein GY928_20480, partial [Colwellia sp.]|nr:hypothetical protein [Colwellia sp.]
QHSVSIKLHTYFPSDKVESRVSWSFNQYNREKRSRYYSIQLGTDWKIVPNVVTFKGDVKWMLADRSNDIFTVRVGSKYTINERHSLLFDFEGKRSLDSSDGRLYTQLSYRFNY